MLDHLSIAVSDLARAVAFYDAIMAALGVPKVGEDSRWAGYGQRCDPQNVGRSYISLRLAPAVQAAPAAHAAFKAPSRAAVEAFWSAGIGAGGTDDGPPGLRVHYHPHYYAAFLLDPDGNRIEAVCHAPVET